MAKEGFFTEELNERRFTVTGGFNIDPNLEPEYDNLGNIVAYRLSDGRKVALVVALEVCNKEETEYNYVTLEPEMDKLGFGCLDYDRLDFE